MSIGKNLKKIRKERNLRQKDIADKIGISRSFYSDIENDRKNVSSATLLKISEALDISISFLTTGVKAVTELSDEEAEALYKEWEKNYEYEFNNKINNLNNEILNIINNKKVDATSVELVNALLELNKNMSNSEKFLLVIIFNYLKNKRNIFQSNDFSTEYKNGVKNSAMEELDRFTSSILGENKLLDFVISGLGDDND